MLYIVDYTLSTLEVPDEISLCLFISGCLNNCSDCHSPELQRNDYGEPLHQTIYNLLELYSSKITCVCFLGEGKNTYEEKGELKNFSDYAHMKGLKSCLYSGRNTDIEDWMKIFDYIKVGAFDINRGPLTEKNTNQIMYQKIDGDYRNITSKFW